MKSIKRVKSTRHETDFTDKYNLSLWLPWTFYIMFIAGECLFVNCFTTCNNCFFVSFFVLSFLKCWHNLFAFVFAWKWTGNSSSIWWNKQLRYYFMDSSLICMYVCSLLACLFYVFFFLSLGNFSLILIVFDKYTYFVLNCLWPVAISNRNERGVYYLHTLSLRVSHTIKMRQFQFQFN